jgi:hypothetical protein
VKRGRAAGAAVWIIYSAAARDWAEPLPSRNILKSRFGMRLRVRLSALMLLADSMNVTLAETGAISALAPFYWGDKTGSRSRSLAVNSTQGGAAPFSQPA